MGHEMIENKASDEELFECYKNTKDKEIRNTIIDRYTYIAHIIAKRFCGRGVDFDDLYQVACIGLLYAVERFDVTKGTKFTTYAVPTITGEIKRYFRDKGNFIRIPRRLYEIFSKAYRIHLANATEKENTQMSDRLLPQVISFESDILNDDMHLESTLGQTDEGFLFVEDKDFVDKCMASLDENERSFLHKRYYEEKTQKQIASDLGVSQMCISRMERKLLKKLRDMYFKDNI